MSQSDFVSRGQALVAAGQFQEAVKVCRLGLLGRPTTVEGRVVLGQALLALKRFDEVLAEMRVALDLDHSSIPAQVLKAEALLRKGDTVPALEVLTKARQAAPGDARIMQLFAEAENGAPRSTVSHPAVGFVGSGDTKHYPNHSVGAADVEDSGPGGYTRPTSVQAPPPRRSTQRPAARPMPIDDTEDIEDIEDTEDAAERPEALRAAKPPPPAILAVGDHSGTVEVDPLLEGVEVDDDDFDEVAAPPAASAGGNPAAQGGARGSVKTSSKFGSSAKSGVSKSDRAGGTVVGKKNATATPTMELDLDPDDEDDDDLLETRAPESRAPGPRSSVRNLVAMPSGVIGGEAMGQAAPRSKGKTVPPPRSNPAAPFVPSIANAPASMSS
ncbi:MAG: hypothetical protein HOV81_16610, partial [Kofleriaceae bacterium]|nr:hypothetical protein [Kofleriaceae bacterium]